MNGSSKSRLLCAFALLSACATEVALPSAALQAGAGQAAILMHSNGEATLDGQRMAWERAALTLRFRARSMSRADLAQQFVVRMTAEPGALPYLNEMLAQLEIIGVKQIELR